MFFYENIDFKLKKQQKYKHWLLKIAESNLKVVGNINYIFCNDSYLKDINITYLQHDNFTDIITFPYNYDPIESDIYISIDRVKENADNYKVLFEDELHRVMVHGLLHLLGYNDKSEEEKKEMRNQENICISLL